MAQYVADADEDARHRVSAYFCKGKHKECGHKRCAVYQPRSVFAVFKSHFIDYYPRYNGCNGVCQSRKTRNYGRYRKRQLSYICKKEYEEGGFRRRHYRKADFAYAPKCFDFIIYFFRSIVKSS